jgi:hypothetical protein
VDLNAVVFFAVFAGFANEKSVSRRARKGRKEDIRYKGDFSQRYGIGAKK